MSLDHERVATPQQRRLGPADVVRRHAGWVMGSAGCVALLVALALAPSNAHAAMGQDWSPFVLISGLLLIGLVSEEDGLFAAAGHEIARRARSGFVLYSSAVVLIGVVTALLNLDTSVAFLTPVLIYASRSRGEGEAPLLYGCILLSNAGSLILPGSNLTNLIVLGQLHMTGGAFFRHVALAGVTSVAVTAAIIGLVHHRELRSTVAPTEGVERPRLGVGLLAVAAATALVLLLSNPALPVLAVGVAAVLLRLRPWRVQLERVLEVLGLPVLVGLFGTAVALGTLGRAWSGPATLFAHLGPWATAGLAAVTTVAVNNLPAASLLAARNPVHPFSLLVGLNIGPNLFITGSLAWILWRRAAATAGAQPSLRTATRLGLLTTPIAIAAAMLVLTATGLR